MVDEEYDNLTIKNNGNILGNLNVKGNVGIGTTTPEAGLHIDRADTNAVALKISSNGPGWGSGIIFNNNEKMYGIYVGIDKKFRICDGNEQQDRLVIDAAGNIGIGTITPEARLHIDKANTNDLALKLSSTGPGWGSGIIFNNNEKMYGIYVGIDKKFRICDGNEQQDRLVIDAAGNIGIGTITPNSTLDVKGTIRASDDIILGGADCAEEFDIVDMGSTEPGTVMVIDNNGALRASEEAYDRRVAGVISGAGDLRPGITLGKQANKNNRLPIALSGKVYCKVDADYGTVEVGDLLTTSSTYGHAMKVNDYSKSLGAIIGKAMSPIKTGKGLIPILVALQ